MSQCFSVWLQFTNVTQPYKRKIQSIWQEIPTVQVSPTWWCDQAIYPFFLSAKLWKLDCIYITVMTAAQARGTNISTALDFLFFLGSIEERMVTLRRRWEQLIQSNAKRKQKLLDSLQLQVTYTADLVRHLWILNFTPYLNMNQKLKLLSIPTAAHFLFVSGTELHSPGSRWWWW